MLVEKGYFSAEGYDIQILVDILDEIINSNYELRLLSSQQIAMSSGVSQLEILYNIGDIDAYFLT